MPRPLIAFCTTDIELVYANILGRGVRDAARQFDVDLMVLPGKALNNHLDYQYQYNVLYDYLDQAGVDGVVMSGGAVGNFVDRETFEKWVERFRGLPLVSIARPLSLGPFISADSDGILHDMVLHLIQVHGRKNIVYVSGSKYNVDATARFEGYKQALKDSGIPYRAEYFFQGDFTALSVAGLVSELLDVRKLKVDAIVCANDEMAIATLAQLRDRGIRVPEQIAVTGFDDVTEANATEPPLSTVRQPVYQEGWTAVRQLLSLIRGNKAENIRLAGQLMIRESCGCAPAVHSGFSDRNRIADTVTVLASMPDPSAEVARAALSRPGLRSDRVEAFFAELIRARDDLVAPGDEAIRHLSNCVNPATATAEDVRFLNHMITVLRTRTRAILEDNDSPINVRAASEDFFDRARVVVGEKLLHIESHVWNEHEDVLRELRALMNTMTSTLNSPKEMYLALANALRKLGFGQAMVWVHEHPIPHPLDTTWHRPATLLEVLAYHGPKADNLGEGSVRETHGLLRRAFGEGRQDLVALPLFLTEDQLGLMIVDLDLSRRAVYESMCVQISAVIKLSYLIRTRVQVENRLRDALHELETYNLQLSTISRQDELTGLLNRRGFMHIARQSIHLARNMEKSGLLCFADMDGLKAVNDSYGHEEGDAAIKAMADILRTVFRSADLIGRIGGDEFTVLVLDVDAGFETILRARIDRALENFNLNSEKAWRLSFTFGTVAFDTHNEKTIEDLLSEADNVLYAGKRSRAAAGKS